MKIFFQGDSIASIFVEAAKNQRGRIVFSRTEDFAQVLRRQRHTDRITWEYFVSKE